MRMTKETLYVLPEISREELKAGLYDTKTSSAETFRPAELNVTQWLKIQEDFTLSCATY